MAAFVVALKAAKGRFLRAEVVRKPQLMVRRANSIQAVATISASIRGREVPVRKKEASECCPPPPVKTKIANQLITEPIQQPWRTQESATR